MSRAIYRSLLWLHPGAFRERFGAEMLWLYDETVSAEGATALLADGFASLVRQWLARRITWKVAAAVIGGLLEVGVLLALSRNVHSSRARVVKHVSASETAASVESNGPASLIAMQSPAANSPAPANAANSQATPVSALPVGGAPLAFAVLFGVVFVYAWQRRRFQPAIHSKSATRRHLSGDPTPETRRARPKSQLSIIAD